MPNTTIPFPPTCRVKLGFNSFSAFVSGAKSSWRVALNKGRTSSGSPMAAHGTRSWAKRQHHCHPGHHQAAEPSSHVVGLWTFLSHTGINIIYIILYQARKKKPNYTQARRRSGKKTKKKTSLHLVHTRSQDRRLSQSSFFEFTGCGRDAPRDVSFSVVGCPKLYSMVGLWIDWVLACLFGQSMLSETWAYWNMYSLPCLAPSKW